MSLKLKASSWSWDPRLSTQVLLHQWTKTGTKNVTSAVTENLRIRMLISGKNMVKQYRDDDENNCWITAVYDKIAYDESVSLVDFSDGVCLHSTTLTLHGNVWSHRRDRHAALVCNKMARTGHNTTRKKPVSSMQYQHNMTPKQNCFAATFTQTKTLKSLSYVLIKILKNDATPDMPW